MLQLQEIAVCHLVITSTQICTGKMQRKGYLRKKKKCCWPPYRTGTCPVSAAINVATYWITNVSSGTVTQQQHMFLDNSASTNVSSGNTAQISVYCLYR